MIELILEVSGAQAADLERAGAASRFTFGESGGTIGRAGAGRSHWVLPDGMVSAMHAAISCAGGTFHIEDRNSTNGVVLNSMRIPPGRPHPLRDGDVVRIDPYIIRATVLSRPKPIAPALDDPSPTSGQILDQFSEIWPAASPRERPALDRLPPAHDYVATPGLLRPPRSTPTPPASPPPIPRGYNPAESVYVRPEPEPLPIPADDLVPERVPDPPPVVAKPARSEAPSERRPQRPAAAAGEAGLAELFAAAGIPDVPVTPDLARELGTMLRIVAQGLVDVLRTRQDVKAEFDVEHTLPGLQKNNPFKLARDGTEALRALFGQRHPSFLEPADAFRDSFDDLRKHHVAMSAGIRAAFDAMLAEFEPDRLEERFSRRSARAIVPLPARIRSWDLYRERFEDLAQGDPDDVFRRLFGDAFSEAYSAQLKALKATGGDDHA